jgi:5-methylcytosine-specific restriction enzyme subunit McrC
LRQEIVVREHARLTVEAIGTNTLDRANVTPSAFEWLCRTNGAFTSAGARIAEVEGRRWLRLDNYVGVLQTPCGTTIEIVPKHLRDAQSAGSSRALLRKMICAAYDLPVREAGPVHLQRFEMPLHEWLIRRFLCATQELMRRGLRRDYIRVESEEPFLRGQLDVARQIRQQPGRAHLFQLRHDTFLTDRPENRLIASALDQAAAATRLPQNWQLANELKHLLADVPHSTDMDGDFGRWSNDRLMAAYRPLRPLCEMVLHRQLPSALSGVWQGISMLFPMEKLFERYVAAWLKAALAPNATLTPQAARHSLCQHDSRAMFQLRPDLLIRSGDRQWVLDTKWKLLHGDQATHYGLSQADLYQMFAYGHKYLAGRGDLFLVFPRIDDVVWPTTPFEFGDGLHLHVVPFDLDLPGVRPGLLRDIPLGQSRACELDTA